MPKVSYKDLLPQIIKERLPKHIGIIMDGNGRWAKQRNRPHLFGHRAGAKSIREVVELGVELGIGYLTFYTFSTENWNRPADEVKGLLKMLKEQLAKEIPDLDKQNIYVQFIGTNLGLDPKYWAEVQSIAATTHKNTGMVLNIAFNYGGRLEVIDGIKKLVAEKSKAEIAELSTDMFGNYLWTKGQPDPDLIIRTSGEMRLSNFLLWQSAYSELYVTDTLWPDFTKVEMVKALLDYQARERRFGGRKK